MIQKKNENFRDFRVFNFVLYSKLKTRKSRKVLFYLIIYNLTQVVALKQQTEKTNKQTKNIIKNEYQKQPPEVFYVFKNFAKFTGKHLCQSLCFNKVAGGTCNLIKKEIVTMMFSCEFCEISMSAFFTEHLRTTASRIRTVISVYSCWIY